MDYSLPHTCSSNILSFLINYTFFKFHLNWSIWLLLLFLADQKCSLDFVKRNKRKLIINEIIYSSICNMELQHNCNHWISFHSWRFLSFIPFFHSKHFTCPWLQKQCFPRTWFSVLSHFASFVSASIFLSYYKLMNQSLTCIVKP